MPPHGSDEFADLLRRAVRGEPDAVAEIYERYEARVRTRVRTRLTPALRREFDTLDIRQSVFADVLRDLPQFEDRGERAFLHWLYVRAERKVIAKQRRLRPDRGEVGTEVARDGAPCDAPDPSERATRAEQARRIRELVADLPEGERRVVELRTRERLSFPAIARELALGSEDAARKRYARALRKLEGRWSVR